ncbi:IS3 family transposase, partial [Xanthomonas fragariae]
MSSKRYTDEFKIEAVRQVTNRGFKYAFMQAHCGEFRVCAMCRVLRVNRSGHYAWLCSPNSERAKEDERLLGLIKHHWLASGSVYGHRKITRDLRDLGERCSRHRVHRLMRTEGLRAQVGYGRKPRFHGGMQCKAAANLLDRQFDVTEPDTAWASDFTFIRTHEG